MGPDLPGWGHREGVGRKGRKSDPCRTTYRTSDWAARKKFSNLLNYFASPSMGLVPIVTHTDIHQERHIE